MSCNGMPLIEKLEIFRKSATFKDVIWQRNAYFSFPRILEKIIEIDDKALFKNKLKDLFSQFFMRGRMGDLNHDYIIQRNSNNDLKEKFRILLSKDITAIEKLKSIMELNEVGLFFGTTILSFMYDNEYIIYHEKVFSGIEEANCTWLPIESVTGIDDYILFNEVCKAIQQMYNFKSLGEVHEFFWHGYEYNWDFN